MQQEDLMQLNRTALNYKIAVVLCKTPQLFLLLTIID